MAIAANALAEAQERLFTPAGDDRVKDKQDSGVQGYWRKTDGDIVFSSVSPNGWRINPRKGYIPLTQYGEFGLAKNANRQGGPWEPIFDPFRQLLEQGGIKEFTQKQIVELGWHRKPHPVLVKAIKLVAGEKAISESEAALLVMPQLDGYERQDVPCALCPGRMFNSSDELSRHETLHKEDVQSRRLGDAITKALAGSQSATSEGLRPVVEVMAQAIQQLALGQSETQALLAELLKNKK